MGEEAPHEAPERQRHRDPAQRDSRSRVMARAGDQCERERDAGESDGHVAHAVFPWRRRSYREAASSSASAAASSFTRAASISSCTCFTEVALAMGAAIEGCAMIHARETLA